LIRISKRRTISNIFNEYELSESSVVAIFATTEKEGERIISREIEHYNLDMIISLGYRINSYKATQFRIWATKLPKEKK